MQILILTRLSFAELTTLLRHLSTGGLLGSSSFDFQADLHHGANAAPTRKANVGHAVALNAIAFSNDVSQKGGPEAHGVEAAV